MDIAASSLSAASSGSQVTTAFKEQRKLSRSCSSDSFFLCYSIKTTQRSCSDKHLSYSINRCVRATTTQPKLKKTTASGTMFNLQQLSASLVPSSIRTFLFDDPDTKKGMDMENVEENHSEENKGKETENRSNWVERIMEIRRHWSEKQLKDDECEGHDWHDDCYNDSDGGCDVHYDDDDDDHDDIDVDEGEVIVDKESFSSMLSHVSWSDAKLFSKLAFLCNVAYVIPEIKAADLKKYYGLNFVTSSIHKKAEVEEAMEEATLEKNYTSRYVPLETTKTENSVDKCCPRPSVAYEISASAASYVQSCAKGVLSIGTEVSSPMINDANSENYEQQQEEGNSPRVYNPEMAACVAASTITSVVAADEKQKQKAARDLVHTSPCEWFICDDTSIYTRYFVIQGSDSLASWQANLLFEPTKFEGTDVLVHRGIYEAAKGIYEQFLPEILDHVHRFGDRAKLKFTGHSLGGSLSLLVNLMLLMRKAVKQSSLLPVATFGSPFVFCGGQKILDMLGLDESHVHCVMMHRDIVPRAFSCNYPDYVAQILKRLNGTFRSHPCLNKKKLLYSPMGAIFILQPDEKSSPGHPLLPPGSALYALENKHGMKREKSVRAFLNNPHPVETLSDPTAYGSEGTILRDHDSSNYLKAVNQVIKQNTRPMMVMQSRKQRKLLWPLLHDQQQQNLEDNLANKEIMTNA